VSRLWEFVLERAQAARTGQYGVRDPHDADTLMAVLAEHQPVSAGCHACAGCGFTAEGNARTPMVDFCPTLRALAWRWHNHPSWRRHWALDAAPHLETWPPELNCFCGGGAIAHRRGERRHCRPSRWERKHAAELTGAS
jgi:hypothetical protein